MNEIVKKFSLAGHKVIGEIHLRQPGFTFNAHERFTKTKKEEKNLKEQEILKI